MQHHRDHGGLQAGRALDRQIDRARGFGLDPVAEPAQRPVGGKRCADAGGQRVECRVTIGALGKLARGLKSRTRDRNLADALQARARGNFKPGRIDNALHNGLAGHLDGFVRAIREAGIPVGISQAVDAAEILTVVDLLDREQLRHGLAAVLLQRAAQRQTYDVLFDLWWPLGDRPAADADPRGKKDPRDFALWKGSKEADPPTASWPRSHCRRASTASSRTTTMTTAPAAPPMARPSCPPTRSQN